MKPSFLLQKTEKLSRLILTVISLAGLWLFVQEGVLKMGTPNQPLIFVLLVLFLAVVEVYPMPVWKGFTSISFPMVYAIFVMHGLEFAILSYGLVSFFINLYKRRAFRIVCFNPAQLILSFYFAYVIGTKLTAVFLGGVHTKLFFGIGQLTFIIFPFYIFNNLIVDLILSIRPQPYTFKAWKQKSLQEVNSLALSYIYLVLFYVLGNQNRGQIDVVSFFFFFSPLVGLALLSSSIVRLKKEKAKLKALFSISSELNKKIAASDWLDFLANNLQEFIDVDAWILWKKNNDVWQLRFASGLVEKGMVHEKGAHDALGEIKQMAVYHDTEKEGGPAARYFTHDVKSLLYAPLVLDEELVGMFIFGRSRTKSFIEEDVQSAATLANQLAVLIKTKWLFAEQEKRLILEERNRIARDIHDGVAQSLAGAIMNLETAERKFSKQPEDSFKLIKESREKLRFSLKEVRESIYALRPYPTERVGLKAAVSSRIAAIQRENNIEIVLETRGTEIPLSSMVEKIIFDIFQESVQNAVKHAKAAKIEILLSYQKEHVLLKIKDDGIGFSLFQAMIKAQKQPHFGILHMNEAAEKIQASLQVDSREGEGTEIVLTVPKMGIEGGVDHD